LCICREKREEKRTLCGDGGDVSGRTDDSVKSVDVNVVFDKQTYDRGIPFSGFQESAKMVWGVLLKVVGT
jgi:hypothetical protein